MANGNGRLVENQYVRVGSVVLVVLALCGFVAGEFTWRTNLSRDIAALAEDVGELNGKIVGKSVQGWHRPDMELWIHRTENKNPEWDGADPYAQPALQPVNPDSRSRTGG